MAAPTASNRLDRAWAAVLRRPWLALAGWAALTLVVQTIVTGRWLGSWFYVVTGVQVLTGPHPLALYASHPELQMGPLTFLLAVPLALLPQPIGIPLAALVMEALGFLALREARAFLRPGAADRRWFLASAAVLLGWNVLAVRYGHLDDVLALVAALWGARLARSGAGLPAAVAIGLSIDCKPWTAPLALLLLALPRGRRLPAAALLAGVVLVAWLPFVLGSGSFPAAGFTIAVDPAASIRLLGLATGRTPVWCRPAQLLIGALLVALAVRRGKPASAVLLVVAVRLLLDPATHGYYDAGLLLGACVLDLEAAIPIATLVALVGVHVVPLALPTAPQAVMRLTALLLLVVLAFLPRRRSLRPVGSGGGRRPLAVAGT